MHSFNLLRKRNKKTKDVQFYVEVMDVVQTLGGGKRSAYDPDEIEEEQRERDRKNKINMDFQSFVNRVNHLWSQPQFGGLDLEFDQPLRELGFHGVPHKTTAFIVPTSSCLVELIDGLGQKNFDMTIVFKDFKRDVLRIYSSLIDTIGLIWKEDVLQNLRICLQQLSRRQSERFTLATPSIGS